jgi:hypothetical protein
MKDDELLKRVNYLLEQGQIAIDRSNSPHDVNQSDYVGFLGASVSFIGKVYGTDHTYFNLFKGSVRTSYVSSIQQGISILKAIKDEIEQGWLRNLKELITAEVFTDFLEMSEYLLKEDFHDAAAVMIGSVLEERLRQLANTYAVDTHITRGSDSVPKKASLLNDDLKKANAYRSTDHKQITTWLDLRNSAAHGKYGDYTPEQVKLMLLGVMNFISRVS